MVFALSAPVFADADLSVNERGNVSLTFDFDLSNLGYTMVKDDSEKFCAVRGCGREEICRSVPFVRRGNKRYFSVIAGRNKKI
ncbi:MAG: hypothetical protein L6V93_17890 [Clostridiales bacterium]|nr:MAG: hypothetical protein L6V93_17890 [Clostridiales bacterium]